MIRNPPDERGETTTQIVLVVPVVISILLIAVQAAVYFHTSNIAGAAASQGASAAASHGESVDTVTRWGSESARAILVEAGVRDASATVTVSSDTVTVTVDARVPRIVPYFPGVVRRVATEPRERFLTESMR